MSRRLAAALVSAALGTAVLVPATSAEAKVPVFKNCTAMHKVYKHGVGKKGARDKVRSGKPVTTFKVSTKIYNAQPRGLDRDRDGVACEQR